MTRKSTLLILSCLLAALPLAATGGNEPGGGAAPAATAGAWTAVRGSLWSLWHNPAAITGTPGIQAGAYFSRQFLLSELSYGSAGAVIPFAGNQAAGLRVSSFGFDAYRESRASASYGITVIEMLSIGVTVNAASLSIRDYGSATTFYADAGVHLQLNQQVHLGFSALNVNRAQLNSSTGFREDLPTILTAGVSYQPTGKVRILADAAKDVDHPLSFSSGIEYEILPALTARIGAGNGPVRLSGGLGLAWQQVRLDLAFQYTERLGYTPHLSLAWAGGSR
jgi:hypothetical protein